MIKLTLSTYGIGIGYVAGCNIIDYHPSSPILDSFWNLPKLDTDYGNTAAAVTVSLAPLIIPVYAVSLPIISGYEYLYLKIKND